MRARLLLLVAVLAVPAVACSAADAGEEPVEESGDAITDAVAVGAVLRATSTVSLREAPSTSSDRLVIIPAGDTVKAIDAQPTAGFYHVRYGESEGWVFGRYLARGDGSDEASGGYEHSRKVKIVYQGSCDFLHRCDSYSRRLPVGQVNWGCLGHGAACVDSEHWMSGPSRAYCGKTVKVCKGTTCTTAKIMDVSVSQSFEASQGVLDAVGIGYGGGSTCSNTYLSGDPNVTVYW